MMGGSNAHTTDQELIDQVIKKAQDHQITLTPEAVTVQRIGTPGAPAVYRGGGLQRSRDPAGIFLHSAFHSFEREQGLLDGRFFASALLWTSKVKAESKPPRANATSQLAQGGR